MTCRFHSTHRLSRFSVSWVLSFQTCYNPGSVAELTDDGVRELLSSADPVVLLQAVTANGFENDSRKSRLYHRLCLIVVDDVSNARTKFVAAGGIPLVTRYMVVNVDEQHVQLSSCRMLAAVSELGDEAQVKIAECEAVEAVVDALTSYAADVNVQRVCIVALHNFSLHPANRSVMHVSSTLLAVVRAFRVVLYHPTYVALAATTIATAVFQDDRSRLIVGENGAIHVLTEALRIHRFKADVQHACNLALQNILFGCPHNISRFKELDGMDALFYGILAHLANPLVVRNALCALNNVLAFDPTVGHSMFSEHRWLILTCSVSKNLSEDMEVAEQVIRIWISFCQYDTSVEKQGVRRLTECVKNSGTSFAILKWMRKSILTQNQRLFGAICRLYDVMSLYSGKRRIEPSVTLIKTEKAIELCILAFEAFEKERRPTLDALSTLSILISGRDDLKIKFNDTDGVEAVVKVMKTNADDENLNVECCRILDIAADGQLLSAKALKAKETLCSAVMNCMMNFEDSAAVQENAISVLLKVAASKRNDAIKLVEADVYAVLEAALIKHKENPGVESLASQLLNVLEAAGESQGSSGTYVSVRDCLAQTRSRSRTIQDSEAVRARALKSRSPILLNKNGRVVSGDTALQKRAFKSLDILKKMKVRHINGETI